MIIDFFITFLSVIISLVTSLLSLIPFSLTFGSVISRLFLWILSPFLLLTPFWDMPFAYAVMVALISFESAWWGYEVLIKFFHWITFKPKH